MVVLLNKYYNTIHYRVETNIQVLEYSISNDSTQVLNFYSATRGHGFVKITVIYKSQSRGATHVTCLANLKIITNYATCRSSVHWLMYAIPIINVNYLCRFNVSPVDEYSSTREKVQLSTRV